MDNEVCKDTLLSFLSEPLSDTNGIFRRFAELPGAKYVRGDKPGQAYLFVPGKKEKRVVLLAHVDTVWDKSTANADIPASFEIKDGAVVSASDTAGIGADDRAGCAALWLLRESGHSLLLIDGEENGHTGAAFLKRDKKLLKLLNRHLFFLSLDLSGVGGYMFHAVKNPKSFGRFIESFGYRRLPENGGSDIFYLCRKAAGVNVGIGYSNEHKPAETISLDGFYQSVEAACRILENADRAYRIPLPVRIFHAIRHSIAVVVKPLLAGFKK